MPGGEFDRAFGFDHVVGGFEAISWNETTAARFATLPSQLNFSDRCTHFAGGWSNQAGVEHADNEAVGPRINRVGPDDVARARSVPHHDARTGRWFCDSARSIGHVVATAGLVATI